MERRNFIKLLALTPVAAFAKEIPEYETEQEIMEEKLLGKDRAVAELTNLQKYSLRWFHWEGTREPYKNGWMYTGLTESRDGEYFFLMEKLI